MKDVREALQRTLSGTYTVERELGGGGMSRVFVARDTSLERPVVVKVLSPELAAGVSAERFTRETKLAASLQQANIVPVLAAGVTGDGLPYYTMPFVEGQSLRSRLAKSGALPVSEVIGIMRDVSKALAYAHERGIVHRDIKPDNVLLSGGTAVVTDFGIAKALTAARTDSGGGTLTQLGTAIGTPAYMAPEQAAGDPNVDRRADIYSLGCLAYELLAGQSPFHGRTPARMMAAQMGEEPAPITTLRPETPPALAELVMRCLAKDPGARPQAAQDLVQALDSVTSGGSMQGLPSVLLGGPGMLPKALGLYAVAFGFVAILAKAAIVGIGLPDWVFPGALIVMALGLPAILFTAYVARVNRQIATVTPTFTPGGTPSLTHGTMATLAIKATPHVSWKRTATGGAYAVGTFVFLVGAFMVLRALGIGPAASLFAAGKLDRNEPILVADFGVKGSVDSSLAGVVSEALRTDLGQSNVLRVVSARTIRDALTRMRRPDTSRLDGALAREVAQRENIRAVIDGDITTLGTGYIITARLINASTGDELTSFHEIADGPKDLIVAVGKVSRSLRGKIGESLRSVQQSPALEAVSTASLEALRKYADGSRAMDIESDPAKSIALLKEAVAIDSTFAMAWRKLAVSYGNSGFGDLQDSAIVHAFRFRDRLTDRERNNVLGYYWNTVGHDRAKAAAAYEGLVAAGNIDAGAHNLANIYRDRREYARAESLYRRRIAVDGGPFVTHSQLIGILVQQGRMREADSALKATRARFPTVIDLDFGEALTMAYQRGEVDSTVRVMRSLSGNRDPGIRSSAFAALGAIDEMRGRLTASVREISAGRGVDSARGIPVIAVGPSMDSAYRDAWYYDRPAVAASRIDAALARNPLRSLPVNRRPYFGLATVYAMAGRPDKARAMLAQYDAEQRDTTLRRFDGNSRHLAEAEILLAENHPQEAIAAYRAAAMLPDGPFDNCDFCEDVGLARLFEKAGAPDSAIIHYEAALASHFPFRPFVDAQWLAYARRRLGGLYEQRGDKTNAAKYYREFVEQWKNADAELQPQVAEVRRRLSRLADIESKP